MRAMASEAIVSAPEPSPRFPRLARATLGILAGNLATRAPGGVASNVSNTRTYRELRRYAARSILAITMLPTRLESMNDTLDWADEDLWALPPMATTIAAQRHLLAAHRVIRRLVAASDVLFVRMPFQIPWLLFGIPKPKVLHFGSDVYAIVRASTDYRGPKRLAALGYARLGDLSFRAMAHDPTARFVTNGRGLLFQYGAHRRGAAVVSSCLSEREMDPPGARPPYDPARLLFVGYLRPEKGLGVLLDAFDRLRRDRRLTLTIAGGSDRASVAERDIRARIAASPWAADVATIGHVDFGPPLFDLYRAHDVLVLPSLSEGTPRTLVEARAFHCPVVASRVGGIPTSVRDGHDGLLFPPGDAAALAAAIARLLDDEALRARLVAEGRRTAGERSVERFAGRLAGELEQALAAAEATEP